MLSIRRLAACEAGDLATLRARLLNNAGEILGVRGEVGLYISWSIRCLDSQREQRSAQAGVG